MADNLTAPAAGALLASDDVGGVQYPRTKMAWGVDGSAVDAADAANARIPVKVGEGLSAATVVAGQVTAATGTSAALPSAVARRIRVRSLIGNTATIYLGPSGVTVATGYPLEPGDITPPLELSNLNVLRAISGTAAQVLAYLGEV